MNDHDQPKSSSGFLTFFGIIVLPIILASSVIGGVALATIDGSGSGAGTIDSERVDVVVEVAMFEMGYEVRSMRSANGGSPITRLSSGDLVRFEFINEGTVDHEAVVAPQGLHDEIAAAAMASLADTGQDETVEEAHDEDATDETAEEAHDEDTTDDHDETAEEAHDEDTTDDHDETADLGHDEDTTDDHDETADLGHDDAMDHGENPTIVLSAGERGELTVRVSEAGTLTLGCHIPGHWEAGMSESLVVS